MFTTTDGRQMNKKRPENRAVDSTARKALLHKLKCLVLVTVKQIA